VLPSGGESNVRNPPVHITVARRNHRDGFSRITTTTSCERANVAQFSDNNIRYLLSAHVSAGPILRNSE
jgi:hypothetical protein